MAGVMEHAGGKTHLLSLAYMAFALIFTNSFVLGFYEFSKLYASLNLIKFVSICHP